MAVKIYYLLPVTTSYSHFHKITSILTGEGLKYILFGLRPQPPMTV